MVRAALMLALVFAGCAGNKQKPVDFSEARKNFVGRDYPQVWQAWTQHTKVVKDVGTVIELWATMKSWEFRQAYIEQYAQLYSLADDNRKALYRTQLEQARASYEVHVVVQMTSHAWNDLDSAASPWKVTLVDGAGVELSPTKIVSPRLPELYEMKFFPSRTEFSRTYVMKFDRKAADDIGFSGPASGRMTLRVVSPAAKAEVSWLSR